MRRAKAAALAALAAAIFPGCSVKKIAVNSIGSALASSGTSWAGDEDPQLIWDATPFALKTMESLLEETPRHRALLTAATRGFVQYTYGHLQQEADALEGVDLGRATAERRRAKRLFVRARDYGLRGLELDLPGLRAALAADPSRALAGARKKHVELLYWTGLAWFGAISLAKDDSELTADQGRAEALLRRALALDEAWDRGSVHEFFISWEARGESVGGSLARAREHFDRALALSRGCRASPYVAYAESVSVARQDRKEFEDLLGRALAVDINCLPGERVANLTYQGRARFLLGRVDELFVE